MNTTRPPLRRRHPWLLAAALLAVSATAQTPTELPCVLPESRIRSLQDDLRDWYEVEVEANALRNEATALGDSSRDRRRAEYLRKKARYLRDKARDNKAKFREALERESVDSGDLLARVGDLLAIFDGCFPYDKQHNGGVIKKTFIDKKEGLGYAVRYPPKYRPDENWPLVFVLPDRIDDGSGWERAADCLERQWPEDEAWAFEQAIVACPMIPEDMDLDASVDPASPTAADDERRTWVLSVLGDIFFTYRIHTDHVYLQATGASVPCALRLATLFPDRFAALVLVNPPESPPDDAEALANLNGTGVLLIADEAHADGTSALEKALTSAGNDDVTRRQLPADAAIGDMAEDTAAWLRPRQRTLFRDHIVLVPTHDQFRKAYWLDVLDGAYLADTALADRPRIEISVDRANNRIDVQANNVTLARVLLNDALVNLDEPITFVLNGRVKEVRQGRSLSLLANARDGLIVLRNDPRFVFVADVRLEIPPAEVKEPPPRERQTTDNRR